jgi:hypothetical protein
MAHDDSPYATALADRCIGCARRPSGFGETPKNEIPDDVVRQLRAEYQPSTPGSGVRALADRYGLHYNVVKAIVLGKSRKTLRSDDDDAEPAPAQQSTLFDID